MRQTTLSTCLTTTTHTSAGPAATPDPSTQVDPSSPSAGCRKLIQPSPNTLIYLFGRARATNWKNLNPDSSLGRATPWPPRTLGRSPRSPRRRKRTDWLRETAPRTSPTSQISSRLKMNPDATISARERTVVASPISAPVHASSPTAVLTGPRPRTAKHPAPSAR